jgi:hypothetical protein
MTNHGGREAECKSTKTVQPDVTVVTLTGRMVLGNELQRLEQAIDDLVKKQQKKIVFDLARGLHRQLGSGRAGRCMRKGQGGRRPVARGRNLRPGHEAVQDDPARFDSSDRR